MRSNNPVFSRSDAFTRGGYATFDERGSRAPQAPTYGAPAPTYGAPRAMTAEELQRQYQAPAATPVQAQRMTLDDVIMRTAMLFGALLLTAVPTYLWASQVSDTGQLVSPVPIFGAMLAAFVLGLVISFSRAVRPGLIVTYALLQGVFVGGISGYYGVIFGSDIVPQAVLGTLGAFVAMLSLYKVGAVRATPRFTRTLLIATAGYMVFSLVHVVGVVFGAWDSIYFGEGGPSLLGIGLSLLGTVLASLFLVLDFDQIEQGIRNGVPAKFAWTAAFGLLVTLVWLYLEILRLLAILRGDD